MTTSDLIATVALFVSVFSLGVAYAVERRTRRQSSYLELERASELLFTLPIERDFLNKLYYRTSLEELPSPDSNLEDLTEEQRALLNYGTLLLDYFEQLVLLDREGQLPEGITATWLPWLRECARSPYFRWVWKAHSGHYHPELALAIRAAHSQIGKGAS